MKIDTVLSLSLAEQLRTQPGRCYLNSCQALHRLLQRGVSARYVEGFALWQTPGFYEATAHAWLLVDEQIVDVSRPATAYFPGTIYVASDLQGQPHFPLFRHDRKAQRRLDAAREQAIAKLKRLCSQPMAIWMVDDSYPTTETVLNREGLGAKDT